MAPSWSGSAGEINRADVLCPALIRIVKGDPGDSVAGAVIERHVLDPGILNDSVRPPRARVLRGSPVRHVEPGRDRDDVAVDRCDEFVFLLVIVHATNSAPWSRGIACADTDGIADEHLSGIDDVIRLIEDEKTTRLQARRAPERDLGRAFRVATRPRGEIARPARPIEAASKTHVFVATETARVAATAELENRLVGSRAPKGHVALHDDLAREVVGAGVQEDDLAGRTRGDGIVDLRRRRARVQRSAERGAVRNATRDADIGPVDGPRRTQDP